jgi:hypothetical protein
MQLCESNNLLSSALFMGFECFISRIAIVTDRTEV